jgi:hypothetical protein
LKRESGATDQKEKSTLICLMTNPKCALKEGVALIVYLKKTSLSRSGSDVETGGVAQSQSLRKTIFLSNGRGAEGVDVIHEKWMKKASLWKKEKDAENEGLHQNVNSTRISASRKENGVDRADATQKDVLKTIFSMRPRSAEADAGRNAGLKMTSLKREKYVVQAGDTQSPTLRKM